MLDQLRLLWLFYLATAAAQRRCGYGPPTLAVMEDGFAVGEAGLLLDRRLVKAHGSRVASLSAFWRRHFYLP